MANSPLFGVPILHNNVTRLFDNEIEERILPDWSMGFREVSELDLKMVNEILSWNRLISASRTIDKQLIMYMLERFKTALK